MPLNLSTSGEKSGLESKYNAEFNPGWKAGMAEDKEAGRVCTQVACQRKHQGQGQSIGKSPWQ